MTMLLSTHLIDDVFTNPGEIAPSNRPSPCQPPATSVPSVGTIGDKEHTSSGSDSASSGHASPPFSQLAMQMTMLSMQHDLYRSESEDSGHSSGAQPQAVQPHSPSDQWPLFSGVARQPGAWYFEVCGAGEETDIPQPPTQRQAATETIMVPSSEHVAEIVGRQGCKIKALRAKTNTYIKTPVRGDDPTFVITGKTLDVLAAREEIEAAADHFTQIRASRRHSQGGQPAPGHMTAYVRVPYRVVGLVVGPKGATIKRIQQDTHTYIITPGREREPLFEVTGLPANVNSARTQIEEHIQQRTGVRPTTACGDTAVDAQRARQMSPLAPATLEQQQGYAAMYGTEAQPVGQTSYGVHAPIGNYAAQQQRHHAPQPSYTPWNANYGGDAFNVQPIERNVNMSAPNYYSSSSFGVPSLETQSLEKPYEAVWGSIGGGTYTSGLGGRRGHVDLPLPVMRAPSILADGCKPIPDMCPELTPNHLLMSCILSDLEAAGQ